MEQVGEIFFVAKCNNCKLAYVDPIPCSNDLVLRYDEKYYSEWVTVQEKARIKIWKYRLKRIENRMSKGSLLDIGCGDGLFLKLAKDKGWVVEGCEISPFAARYASERIGKTVSCGEIFDLQYPSHSFDVITLWHVLEHTSSPVRILLTARKLLKPGGYLFFAVPNMNDRIMKVAYWMKKRRNRPYFSIDGKEPHLLHFSISNLLILLEKTNFIPVETGPDYGIVEPGKKIINTVAGIIHYLTNLHWYNSIEIIAR